MLCFSCSFLIFICIYYCLYLTYGFPYDILVLSKGKEVTDVNEVFEKALEHLIKMLTIAVLIKQLLSRK